MTNAHKVKGMFKISTQARELTVFHFACYLIEFETHQLVSSKDGKRNYARRILLSYTVWVVCLFMGGNYGCQA